MKQTVTEIGTTMSDDQPFFRFNPGAYEEKRAFERSSDACEACSRPCVWKYVGGIYALTEPIVCARCIANGELGRLLGDDQFSLHDVEIHDVDTTLKQEVLQRTPEVACFNPFEWPVIDAIPLAFLGYGEDENLLAIPEVRSAIESAFAELGWEFEGPTPYALIFKEVEGDRYRVTIDLD